jgi:hypothetical protein
MSEWIDFAVYVTLIMLVFVFLPRHGRQFTVPMIADRNPEWLASHRDVVARLERSRWFLHACYVWAAGSIAVLLGVTLDLFASPFGAVAPKWEVLKDLNSTFLIVGFLGWGACSLLWFRWLGTHVPLAETRRATLKPRVASDYLARSQRIAVEALTVLHLAAWLVVGALGLAGGAKFWWSFALIVGMTVLFALIAHLVPRRRPGYVDHVFGDAYRQVEVRAAYFMRLWPLAAGAIGMTELITGVDLARVGQLLIVSFVCVLGLMLLRVRPIVPASGATPGYGAFTSERRSAA